MKNIVNGQIANVYWWCKARSDQGVRFWKTAFFERYFILTVERFNHFQTVYQAELSQGKLSKSPYYFEDVLFSLKVLCFHEPKIAERINKFLKDLVWKRWKGQVKFYPAIWLGAPTPHRYRAIAHLKQFPVPPLDPSYNRNDPKNCFDWAWPGNGVQPRIDSINTLYQRMMADPVKIPASEGLPYTFFRDCRSQWNSDRPEYENGFSLYGTDPDTGKKVEIGVENPATIFDLLQPTMRILDQIIKNHRTSNYQDPVAGTLAKKISHWTEYDRCYWATEYHSRGDPAEETDAWTG